MKKSYKFLIVFVLFSTQTFAKIVISDESIKLQEVWESPQSSLKQKIRIVYHDFKEPFPWGINLWRAYNHAWDTRINIEQRKETTIKDRALLRMYENKILATTLGVGALTELSILVLGKMDLLPKRMSPSRKQHLDALKTLKLNSRDLEGKTFETQEKILNDAFKKLARERHPDRGGTEQDFIDLKDAYEKLKKFYYIDVIREIRRRLILADDEATKESYGDVD